MLLKYCDDLIQEGIISGIGHLATGILHGTGNIIEKSANYLDHNAGNIANRVGKGISNKFHQIKLHGHEDEISKLKSQIKNETDAEKLQKLKDKVSKHRTATKHLESEIETYNDTYHKKSDSLAYKLAKGTVKTGLGVGATALAYDAVTSKQADDYYKDVNKRLRDVEKRYKEEY